ncbi:hypothetical protein [Saccharibacillus alkalitolerans]|uniref:DUF4352 domain-containing protein n=1 Tax=Saccharibacillus alkalitolerans TaxID=2705290 RepID=A0ABX0F493_9BACL|nr:hypothetical protein [Saccharibacillus alkalitolerans]NGZ74448.1 hypothetical protein [Saccharibacillus alkalitolerans]
MRRKGKWMIAVGIALFAAVLAWAGSSDVFVRPKPIHHVERVGDLLYTIDLEQDIYERGDMIRVRAAVQNLGERTFNYISGSSTCPTDVKIDIAHAKQGEKVRLGFQKHACTTDLGFGSLAPGQSTGNEEVFSTEYIQGNDSPPAPAGLYEVKFDLHPFEGEIPSLDEPSSAPDGPPTGSSFKIRVRR